MPIFTYERKLVTILKTKLVYNNMLKSDHQSFMDMLDAGRFWFRLGLNISHLSELELSIRPLLV
jgi:hypothetical protein